MAMRWRCPPENSCGYLCTASAGRPTRLISATAWSKRSASLAPMPWIFIGSVRIWPIVKRGLRLAYGFWKMIWMRRRYAMSSASDILSRSLPSHRIWPLVACDQAHQHHADRRLARARLAHHAERAALVEIEARFLDRLDGLALEDAGLQPVLLAQLLGGDQRRASAARATRCGSRPMSIGTPVPFMKSSITGRRLGLTSRRGRQASNALV